MSDHASNASAPSPSYIDLEQLYPGDVLLSTSRALTSAAIRKVTGSPYSHAALHIGSGIIVESTSEDGIAFAALELFKAETDHRNRVYRIFATVPSAKVLHVYRHESLVETGLSLEQQLELSNRVHARVLDQWGKDYAPIESLGAATAFMDKAPRLKSQVLRTARKLGADKNKVVPGAFCSELVAQVLTDSGLPPLHAAVPPGRVSPAALVAPPNSRLVRQVQANCQPDPGKPNDDERLEGIE